MHLLSNLSAKSLDENHYSKSLDAGRQQKSIILASKLEERNPSLIASGNFLFEINVFFSLLKQIWKQKLKKCLPGNMRDNARKFPKIAENVRPSLSVHLSFEERNPSLIASGNFLFQINVFFSLLKQIWRQKLKKMPSGEHARQCATMRENSRKLRKTSDHHFRCT